jgi:hypothetical protein
MEHKNKTIRHKRTIACRFESDQPSDSLTPPRRECREDVR